MITLEMQFKPTLEIVQNKPFELMKKTLNDGFKDDQSAVENP